MMRYNSGLARILHERPAAPPDLRVSTALCLPSLLDIAPWLCLRRSGCARLVSTGISGVSHSGFMNNPD